MIKRNIFFLLAVLLASCESRFSANSTITPMQTETLKPTETQIPKPTPTKEIQLRNLFISNEDINGILGANYYQNDLIILESMTESNLEIIAGGFSSSVGVGTIWLTLARLLNSSSCSYSNLNLKNEYGTLDSESISIPDMLDLPNDLWAIKTNKDNILHLGFSIENICVGIDYEMSNEIGQDDAIAFLSIVTQKQYYKIEDMIY